MNIRLLILMAVASIGAQLNAGYFTTSYIAQGLVPAALVGIGAKSGCADTLDAGLVGLTCVVARYALSAYNCSNVYHTYGTKAVQVVWPLGLAYCLHAAAQAQDAAYATATQQADDNGTEIDPAIKNGDFQRSIRNMFLGLGVTEAALQICC